ncbi:retrovirus-related pol polyprotein from transposon TNT 1-94 [Tanacetum coccineum]
MNLITLKKRHIREPIWYLDSGCSRSMIGVKSYLYNYVEQPGPKVVFGDNSSCITEGYGSINCGGITFAKVAFVNGLKYNLISISQLCDAKYIVQFDDNPMYMNHEKDTLVIVDEYSRTDNGTEFKNYELESFCDEKGISQNFYFTYTPEQNGIAKRKNRTLIEAARTICLVFIHNHKDHLGKFDAKADDGYFLGYSFNSKAFRVFNTRRQQIKETYHVTFDKSMEAIRMTHLDNINQILIFHITSFLMVVHSLNLSKKKHVPKVIAPNEPDVPHTEDAEGPPDQINIEGTHEQNVQDKQIITQSTKGPSGQNTKVLVSIIESLVPDVPQSHISNQASTSSHPAPQDRWLKDQHIVLMNIIGDPGEGMLTRSMAAKLTAASASECLFTDFLSEIEPKKVSKALKYLGWVDAMQEELNQFYRNKVWTLVPLPYRNIAIGSKWMFRKRKMNMKLLPRTKQDCVPNGCQKCLSEWKTQRRSLCEISSGLESSEFPDYICKLDKALYGLKQVPRAWYETLSTFLIQNKFFRGRIDNTLFIYRSKGDVLLVQVYVDDIIFGSTSYKLCKQFEKLMTKKFEMSMMGELTYFLGLQIKQDDKRDIYLSRTVYKELTKEI